MSELSGAVGNGWPSKALKLRTLDDRIGGVQEFLDYPYQTGAPLTDISVVLDALQLYRTCLRGIAGDLGEQLPAHRMRMAAKRALALEDPDA